MSGPARRSRLVALGLSVGGLLGLVTGMVATEHPRPAAAGPAAAGSASAGPSVVAPDPFTAGGPATPPSARPADGRRIRQTITSAS
jgi:hypothetical protein